MIKTALLYSAFAAISIAVNIASQNVALLIINSQLESWLPTSGTGGGDTTALWLAIFVGTGCGLVTKYVLDKKYIFGYKPRGRRDEASKFFLYTVMGVVTTAIFWGSEWFFYLALDYPWAKDLGALIGLTVGYLSKYYLDKRFVFKTAT